jgi:hypothetical protein
MKRVFISYSANDVQIAKDVYDVLRRLGMDVWLDLYEIGPGDDVTRRIEDGIRGCQLFVAIITQNSVSSNWVQKELKIALENSLSKADNTVIPIVLDGTQAPEFISHIEPIILRPYDYQSILYKDLANVVDRILRERPYNTNTWSGDKEYIQDISRELSSEFPAKREYRLVSPVYPIYSEAVRDQDEKIRETRKKLKKASKGYRIKAYIVLGMMITLLGAAFYLFYYAGDIVAEETKKIVPLIDSTQKKQATLLKNDTIKKP